MAYSSGVDINHSYPDYHFPIMIPSFSRAVTLEFPFQSTIIIIHYPNIIIIYNHFPTYLAIFSHQKSWSWSFFMGNSMNFPSFPDFFTIPFHSSQPSPPSAGTPATAAVPRLAAAPTSHGWPRRWGGDRSERLRNGRVGVEAMENLWKIYDDGKP